jgi:hypothetical protein
MRIITEADKEFGKWNADTTTWKNVHWPVILLDSGFEVVTPSQAVQARDWPKCGQVRDDVPHKLTTDPSGKRAVHHGGFKYSPVLGAFVTSPPYKGVSGLESTPYKKEFGYMPDALDIDQLGVMADGPRGLILREGLR